MLREVLVLFCLSLYPSDFVCLFLCCPGCPNPFKKSHLKRNLKHLKNGNFRLFRFFNISSQYFYFFKSKSVNLFEFIGLAIFFRNVHHSCVWDDLRVVLHSSSLVEWSYFCV